MGREPDPEHDRIAKQPLEDGKAASKPKKGRKTKVAATTAATPAAAPASRSPPAPPPEPKSPSRGGLTRCIYFPDASLPMRLDEIAQHHNTSVSAIVQQMVVSFLTAHESGGGAQERSIEFSCRVYL